MTLLYTGLSKRFQADVHIESKLRLHNHLTWVSYCKPLRKAVICVHDQGAFESMQACHGPLQHPKYDILNISNQLIVCHTN